MCVASEEEVVFIRTVHAVFGTVVHKPGVDHVTVVAHEHVLLSAVLVVFIGVYTEEVLENLCKGIFEFGFEVLSHGFAERLAGVNNHVAHHDEHDRVAGRTRITSGDIERVAITEIHLQRFICAHAEHDIFHCSLAFIIAFVGKFVADAEVKLPCIETKLFHRQSSQVNIVIG